MGIILNICNQKGGVGKTSACIEIATILGLMKYRVLVVDLDPQGNLSRYSGVDLTLPSIYDVFEGKAKLKKSIQKTEYYSIITANTALVNIAFKKNIDYSLLKRKLEEVDFDFVVIDNAPAKSPLLMMSYIASDYTLIASDCDDGSLDGVAKIIEDVELLKLSNLELIKKGKPPITNTRILGIMFIKKENTNMHDFAFQELVSIGADYGVLPFKTTLRKAIKVSECKKVKQSMVEYATDHELSKDYIQLVYEILSKIEVIK